MKLTLKSRSVVRLLLAFWLVSTGVLFLKLIGYSATPGTPGKPPGTWPSTSLIARVEGEPSLIMMVHPHCPCSRASLSELSEILAKAHVPINTTILFVKPPTTGTDWEKTDVWNDASSIPGVNLLVDADGQEAERFNARTSGQVMLYGPDNTLLFAGGITVARGHLGDNDGIKTVLNLLAGIKTEQSETAVFGCPLFDDRDLLKGEKGVCRGSHK